MAKCNMIRWKKEVRIYMIIAIEAVLMVRYFAASTVYGVQNGLKITPCVLPILFMTDLKSITKILIYLGMILLFCNAPFLEEDTPYFIIRSKRKSWWMGECMYIWGASFCYLVLIMILPLIVLLPVLSVDQLWGSLLVDFMNNGSKIDLISLPENIIKIIYPYVAQGLTFLAAWLSFVFLGHLIYMINLVFDKKLPGIIAAVFLVMLDSVVQWLGFGSAREWMYWYSPVNWTTMDIWDISGGRGIIPIWYVFVMPCIFTLILTVIIAVVSRKKQINILSMQ
ncbi:MAG: hypothetical protein MSG78_06545 [Clostridiales bacterium]|nr:hypothetical protein [Clostridiales bacterium]